MKIVIVCQVIFLILAGVFLATGCTSPEERKMKEVGEVSVEESAQFMRRVVAGDNYSVRLLAGSNLNQKGMLDAYVDRYESLPDDVDLEFIWLDVVEVPGGWNSFVTVKNDEQHLGRLVVFVGTDGSGQVVDIIYIEPPLP